MAEFVTGPPHLFASEREGKATIKRPTEIAYFSFDENHELRFDDSSLKWYYTPQIGASLSAGFENFRKFEETLDTHLDALLETLVEKESREGVRCEADIVTWRGMMTKILTAPYSDDGFEMNATLFQVCHPPKMQTNTQALLNYAEYNVRRYIEESHEFKTRERERQLAQKPRPGQLPQELMMFWGYKFETLSVLPSTWGKTPRHVIENRPNEQVSNYAQHCSIVQTSIGDTKLILAGEVDCSMSSPKQLLVDTAANPQEQQKVWDDRPADTSTTKINWVELKTTAELRSPRDTQKFERKLNKFWAQSFLLGVPIIMVGFRSNDETGRLMHVQRFETTKIPAFVRSASKSWSSDVCINFAAKFLNFLKQTITSGDTWKIMRGSRSRVIRVFQVEQHDQRHILSDRFIAWREAKQASPQTISPLVEAGGSDQTGT